ncbi:hypothetical protein [Agarivorans sp. QJM3NY_25]|uniref:hypothetical protein n=1 Tax=Agarivorans sp. QJM3NY_25 TaxID=3421430 RepID=UPI003D7D9B99
MLALSTDLNNARLQLIGEAVNGGHIQFYSGERPLDLAEVTKQTLLLSLALPSPCYQQIADGVMTMQNLDEAMLLATGQLSWARLLKPTGEIAGDLDVSGVNGNGDLKLPIESTQVYQGAYLRLSDWAIV